jgi:fatty-acyl-CoA synthase
VDVAYLLRRAAREHPGSTAVEDARRSITTSALVGRAEALANALDDIGVPDEAPIGILSENRSEYLEVDTAIALGRRVRVALNARLHLEDHRHAVRDSGMKVLVHSKSYAASAAVIREEFGIATIALDPHDDVSPWYDDLINGADTVARLRATDEEAPAWLTYTSGSTGRPKGIVLSHRAIREVAFNFMLELGPPKVGEQVALTQALSHGAGYFFLPYLLSGAGVYVLNHFDPHEVWEVSTRANVRTLKIVPAMLPQLLDHNPRDGLWGYDTVIYGAAPIAPSVLERALDRFGPTLVQIYGQSEAPMTLTCLHKDDHLNESARGSAGRPWRSVELEVRDEGGRVLDSGITGEVFVRGRHIMTGYHRNKGATMETLVDGWIRTRDMARIDDQGFVHLQGRLDDIINSGGYNIAPREVEDVLIENAAVREAVVLGISDERWGTAVTAVVQTDPEVAITEDELITFAKPRLGLRTPKRVLFVEEIPRTSYGKVDKAALRSQLEATVL